MNNSCIPRISDTALTISMKFCMSYEFAYVVTILIKMRLSKKKKKGQSSVAQEMLLTYPILTRTFLIIYFIDFV